MSDTRHIDLDALCTETGCDEMFTLLSNSRRRAILYVLFRSDGDLDFSELVRRVTACETELPVEELDDSITQSIYISLHQTHLPKLDEFGLVEYSETDDGRTVSLTPRARRAIVSADQRTPRRWHRYYALLLTGGLLVGLIAWLSNGAATWRLASMAILIGLCGVVLAHTRAVSDVECDGSSLSLDDLV